MANQRDKDKKLIGFYATTAERAAIKEEAKKRGYSSVAEFLRAVAKGEIKPAAFIIGLAAAWMVAGQPSL